MQYCRLSSVVEQLTCNHQVVGSTPTAGSTFPLEYALNSFGLTFTVLLVFAGQLIHQLVMGINGLYNRHSVFSDQSVI